MNDAHSRNKVFGCLRINSQSQTILEPAEQLRFITKQSLRVYNNARTDMPQGIPKGAMCVQRFDDSLNSAIHITYRISLRSSSMLEPRDPWLKVLIY